MQECRFCSLGLDKAQQIWNDEFFYSTLDNFPVSPGHALIIPKRHVLLFDELKDDEWLALKSAISSVKQVLAGLDLKSYYSNLLQNPFNETSKWFLERALHNLETRPKAGAFNYGVNDGREAGRSVDHLHLHIIPRYLGDMANPLGGVRFVIPEMGNYKSER